LLLFLQKKKILCCFLINIKSRRIAGERLRWPRHDAASFDEGIQPRRHKGHEGFTKNFDLELGHECFFHFLRESFVLFAPSWFNRLLPHSDPWSSSKSLNLGITFPIPPTEV
jgi:hypothetical protein